MTTGRKRRFPVGAEVAAGGTSFRVWAPERSRVEVVVYRDGEEVFPLDREPSGYHSAFIDGVGTGARYRYRLDGGASFPDPASRFQPDGVHEPSQVIDPTAFEWTDAVWRGQTISCQAIYEMHVGTFTPAGTWLSAMEDLPRLAELGITAVEVMPVAEFPGRFGWGYDGVYWFAPYHLYGTADEFRDFVNRAHSLSMGVILDVVYNHLGPDGNYLREFSPYYFSDKGTEWGDAINYDGPQSEPVRELVLSNARYWIEEFHLDGLRLDATQQIFDQSADHIVAALTQGARSGAQGKSIIVIAENEPNDTDLVRPADQGGYGLDALWNDDFHHSVHVALTGHDEAYYSDYSGTPQELISATKYGCLYQGQLYAWQKKRRGRPGLDLAPATAVVFLENHDQVSNSARGERMRAVSHPGLYRAITALMLLTPGTPMLFQGQEFGALTPFCFFADHHAELAKLVREGRGKFLSQFPSLATPEMQAGIPDPADRSTFEACQLRREDSDESIVALHRDLLTLRRADPAFSAQRRGGVDGAVLAERAFVLRFFSDRDVDRLLIINLGADIHLPSSSEPLLAPSWNEEWVTLWSSEAPCYGGAGVSPVETDEGWRISGYSATVLGTRDNG